MYIFTIMAFGTHADWLSDLLSISISGLGSLLLSSTNTDMINIILEIPDA